jgi:hypothetical protein
LTIRNLEEAEVFFGSLPPHFLVDKIVSTQAAVESKKDDSAKLLSHFFVLASAASFEEGLTPASEIIDDIDAPKVFQLLAMTVKGASLNQERLAFSVYVVDDSYRDT